MLPQQVIKEMLGLADDSYGSHTRMQLPDLYSKINQDFPQASLLKATEKGCGETWGDGVSPQAEGSPDGSPASEGSVKLPQLIFKLHRAPGPGTKQRAGSTPASEPRIPSTAPVVGLPPCLPHPHSSSATGEIWCNTASTTCHRSGTTAWYFLQRNAAYTMYRCHEGRAAIL